MKIKRIKVHNLYSYYDAEFEFNDYNIIVGPNNSGKTNLLRILNVLTDLQGKLGSLEYIRLKETDKKLDEYTYIILNLRLTKHEVKLILHSMFDNLNNLYTMPDDSIPEELLDFSILLYWSRYLNYSGYPDYLWYKFDKSILYHSKDSVGITDADTLENLFVKFIVSNNKHNLDSHIHQFDNFLYNYGQKFNKYIIVHSGQTNIPARLAIINSNLDEPLIGLLSKVSNNNVKFDVKLGSIYYQKGDKLNDRTKAVIDYLKNVQEFNAAISNTKGSGYDLTTTLLLEYMLYDKIIKISSIRTSYDALVDILKGLRNDFSKIYSYQELENTFMELANTQFDIKKIGERDHIIIKDNDKWLPLNCSASGYFELLYMLSSILGKENRILILDEPALNLHPIKIKQLAKELRELVNKSGNQVILITHSPYFVTPELLNDDSTNLLYIRKDGQGSKVYCKPEKYKLELKPHLFNPDIFFAKYVILVEGSSDKAVLSAINDNLGNILEKDDAIIISYGGKDNLPKYIDLLDAYKIEYIVVRDDDYILRWNRIDKDDIDKIRLINQLHDDKFKAKLKKNNIDPKELSWLTIDKIDDIKIERSDKIITIRDSNNKIELEAINNYQKVILKINGKQLELDVKQTDNDYYVYRDSSLKLNDLRSNENIIILDGELEDELRRLGWSINDKKIDENEAYEFISKLMKDDNRKNKIKNSKLYQVFDVIEERRKEEGCANAS